MTLRTLPLLGLLWSMMGISGCASYAPPSLGVSGARVVEQSPAATVVQFEIAAQNTNGVELPLRQIRYSLALDGREVFRGVRSPEATLRRLGMQTFTIPAVLVAGEGEPARAGVHTYTISGTLEYITPGSIAQILFDTGVRRPSVRFSQQGEIEFAARPIQDPGGRDTEDREGERGMD